MFFLYYDLQLCGSSDFLVRPSSLLGRLRPMVPPCVCCFVLLRRVDLLSIKQNL